MDFNDFLPMPNDLNSPFAFADAAMNPPPGVAAPPGLSATTNMPFAVDAPSSGVLPPVDLPTAMAGHLASQGVTPDQFMKDPAKVALATTRNPEPPSLGESLSPPLPQSAPTPNFGASPPDATVRNVQNGVATAPQPRGIRNNNPLNIEDSAFTRSQPGYTGSDGRFAQFDTPEGGKAAANALLDTYQNKYGLNTVNGIIGRWAPSSDGNDVTAYANTVAKKIGIDPNTPIPPEKRDALIQAMSDYENGQGGGSGVGAGSASASATTKAGPAPTSANEPTTAFGKRLQEALSGIRAPAAPQAQKISSPAVPHMASTVKGGQLAALLANLVPQNTGTRPLYLSSQLGRG